MLQYEEESFSELSPSVFVILLMYMHVFFATLIMNNYIYNTR